MKLIVWNCQGLGALWLVQTLTEVVKLHRLGLVFISKTKCKGRRYDRLKEKFNYHRIGVDAIGRSGGLLLLWRKDVEVWLQSFSVNHIDATIKYVDCHEIWRFTGFYGNPETSKREETWELLRRLAQGSIRP
ncbi:UNVERIFIED_CONTAM: hypothetical protein Sradi_1766700 [Sesamum radiatum]|uniref:Uncharacterized protein n=1 Tax=Sesamum radiatum TaxID=300843 RepID=A0AAW2TUX2_SESRA